MPSDEREARECPPRKSASLGGTPSFLQPHGGKRNLSKLSELALRHRRAGLTKVLPPLGKVLRGSLEERYLTCGNPDCKCARGQRHGPVWYLSVTLDKTHRAGRTVPDDQVEQVRHWIENYHRVKEHLEKISDINRELMRRHKNKNPRRKKAKK
jgi:hypothetical protein